jgi:NADPH-dependent glutamate synthase beta subunit-like oxidoreductase
MSAKEAKHFVAVVGGAVSGSVAAEMLAEKGIEVCVIEQNDRPYGKIEDGLPRWHHHQRRQEYARIDERLTKPSIHFLPRTKLGETLDFKVLTQEWGLSAVLLANGAWRDRPLPIEGGDAWVGKGVEYQNPFIYWFNHKQEKDFAGRKIEVTPGPIVFGGGLASIDCCKVCQLELYEQALRARGIEVDMLELEKKGIPETCKKHGIEDPAELGVKDTLMFYRRRTVDMPLAQPPANATPEQMEKTIAARTKLLERAMDKYRFQVQDQTLPLEFVIENDHVVGVKTVRTEVDGRKATPVPGTEGMTPTRLVVSSIGSVPEKIPGITMKGEYYTFKDWDLGIYDGVEGVFGVGNVVTGQGNIRASLMHSKQVAGYLTESYFAGAVGAGGAEAVGQHLAKKEPLPPDQVERIRGLVKKHQQRVGYDGDYKAWIAKVTPPDLM